MSAPLEKLLKRVYETIDIVDTHNHERYNQKVTLNEINSAFNEAISIIRKKAEEQPRDIPLFYFSSLLEGFNEGIQYVTDITLGNLLSLQHYLKDKIKFLKEKNL